MSVMEISAPLVMTIGMDDNEPILDVDNRSSGVVMGPSGSAGRGRGQSISRLEGRRRA